MDRLDALLESNPMPTWKPMARAVMVMLSLFLAWAFFAQLDEVSVATGEVVPIGNIKVIQHLEGGIIDAIHVQEGDVVTQGQPLLQLDLGSAGLHLEELQVRLDAALLSRARFMGEAEGFDPEFPEDVAARQPDLVITERRAFEARKRQLANSIGVLKRQVEQRRLEVQELEAKRKATATNLNLARDRLKMSTSLLSEGLTPKMEHLQLEAEVESLEGELKSITASIPRANAAVEEAKERIKSEISKFQREAQDEINKVEQQIARIRELIVRATEQGFRAEIKSPIDGVVKNMRYNTIGGVVKAGEPIMEIVPTGDRLVIDAKLNPTDRGYVEIGNDALVKISTYDFVRYGGLEGKVVRLAPDSSTDENGMPYYKVIVQTDKTYLGQQEGKLPIMPGMQATVDIHTGSKSVMDYLIKPVLKLRHEAFRER